MKNTTRKLKEAGLAALAFMVIFIGPVLAGLVERWLLW